MITKKFRSLRTATLAILMAMAIPSSLVVAQQTPPTGVPAPKPGGPGNRPTTGPGGRTTPGKPGAAGGEDVEGPVEAPPATADLTRTGIAMPNASIIKVILPIYQQLTGKRVILDTNIADNNVRVVVRGPITEEDLVDFIERTLLLNGFAFAPTNKENTVKLINAAGGAPLRAAELGVFTKDRELPETDVVLTYVMNLEYIKPDEAVRIFPQVVQQNSYGTITAVANASAVIIVDDTAVIRQLKALKELVDVPSAQTEPRWFPLERADAESAVDFLTEVLDTDESKEGARAIRSTGQAAQPGGAPPPAGGASGQAAPGAEGSGDGPAVKIIADTRRNSVLVIARPLDLKYVETLLKAYDSESKVRKFAKIPLKFVIASEMLTPLENALSREEGEPSKGGGGGATTGGTGGRGSSSTNATRSNSASTRSTGTNSGSSSGYGGSSSFGGGSSGFGGGGSSSNSGLNAPDAPPVAESVVIGKTLLVADNERNSIIVSGPPESIRLVEEIIAQLDLRPRQVLLSTIIGQMAIDNNREYGINALKTLSEVAGNPDFLGAGALNTKNFPTDADDALADLGNLSDPTKFPLQDGLNLYGKINGDLNVMLRLLETQNKFKVLQRPSIFAANNRKAVISSGQRIAVPTNSYQSGGTVGASQSTNIDYRDVVLKLEVIPLINSENEVTLQISQVNDKVVGTQVIDTNTLPIIGTEEILTTVTITNNQTVVLGGLITERTERTINGVPILIQIPIIKHIFGTTKEQVKREELLIFIQPKILDTSDQTVDANVKEVDRISRGEEVVEFAVPEYKEAKEQSEKAARRRPTGGLFQNSRLFGE